MDVRMLTAKSEGNRRLERLLQSRGLGVTRLVRYVAVVENPRHELLIVKKVSQWGGVVSNMYLGWQLMSGCYWGSDLWDADVLETMAESIAEMTALEVDPSQVRLFEVFSSSAQGQEVLNLFFLFRTEHVAGFEFWAEWDETYEWAARDGIELRLPLVEDRRAVAGLDPEPPNLLESA